MPDFPDPSPRAESAPGGSGAVVLIVDDVPDNLAVLHDALDEAGYTVLVAIDGASALERAARAQPDLILLDALMPGLDGFEVARRLKADAATSAIPIVFMTGLTETEHVVAAFAAGGCDYVTKPIRSAEVLARIASHLHAARQHNQARNALDAFGHATLVVRRLDGRLVWQTSLSRQLLEAELACDGRRAPTPLLAWLQREVHRLSQGGPPNGAAMEGLIPQPPSIELAGARKRLRFTLHEAIGDDQWLLVLREADDAAALEALSQTFGLTQREAEVLYWVSKGKTNRDIADILGMSPRTAQKHLENVFAKLGVETRTAAAGLALGRVKALQGGG